MDPSKPFVLCLASLYVLSGVVQPLIMTLCKAVGLANPTAQLYMVFYYFGPSILALMAERPWPAGPMLARASGIAVFDIVAQTLNYTGASLAGPTIFAIVYASVTVWTAVFSRLVFVRILTYCQWLAILFVFGGLALTAIDSIALGPDVAHGTLLITIGSFGHAGTYVLSEAVMNGRSHGGTLTILQNASLQGMTACLLLTLWTVVYTVPHWDELISHPMQNTHATFVHALLVMLSFALANLLHSVSFFYTLKHYPGGATSAGVFKGLQAVLVFCASEVFYCGRIGGREMCFTFGKLLSLGTVVAGVILFGIATEIAQRQRKGYIAIEERRGNGVSSELA